MKRSTFLSLIASLFAFLGFKKKPKKGVYINYGGWQPNTKAIATEITKGSHYNDVVHASWTDPISVEFGPPVPVTPYINESSLICLDNSTIEVSFTDIKRGKYTVKESKDNGKTWVTVREYDLKDMRA